MALQPFPRQPLAATADATGAAAITNQLQGAQQGYALVYIAASCSQGSPNWSVLLGAGKAATGAPLVYGTGGNVMLGPFLLWPAERVTVVVTGAAAGATILGQALGWMADDPAELLASTPITTALATPLTPVPIAGSVTILGTVPVAVSLGSFISLIASTGALVGDVTSPALAADQGTDSINTTSSLTLFHFAIASFKKATTIALVGSVGPFTTSALANVTPAFGQATSAGNLLVCWLAASTTADLTTASPGWVKAVSSFTPNAAAAIWYKPNCGANEAAPTFTSVGGGGLPFYAQLAEFSGAATVTPVDQTGAGSVSPTPAATQSFSATGVDGATGELVLAIGKWSLQLAAAASFVQAMNNNVTPTDAGNSGATSTSRHADFFWGITPALKASVPLGVAPWDWDSTGTNSPAAGTQAKVVLAASGTKSYRCHTFSCSVLTTGAVAPASACQILDGASVVWNRYLGSSSGSAVTSANAGSDLSNMALKGTAGNSMTAQHSALQASVEQAVNIGAYLR